MVAMEKNAGLKLPKCSAVEPSWFIIAKVVIVVSGLKRDLI
jgi:hypothetical protein